MPKALKIILYSALFFSSFLFFIYALFPMDAIKNRAIVFLEKGLGPSFEVEIEEMGTYRLTGVELKNFNIYQSKEGGRKKMIQAERVTVRFGLFSLLFRKPKARFEFRIGKAKIKGTFQREEAIYHLETGLHGVDLADFETLRTALGIQVHSKIDGAASFTVDPKQPLKTTGNIEFLVEVLKVDKGNLSLGEMGSFPLPDLVLASKESKIKAVLDKGSIQLESVTLKGEDLQLELKGRIFLAQAFSRFRMNLQGGFELSQKLWGVIDPLLPEAWGLELKKQKGPEYYPLSVSGQLSGPQVFSGSLRLYPFTPF